jgi:hypothetical protein
MKPDRTMALVRRVYHEVHLALWAVLTAFVICFAVFVAPKLPEIQAAAERLRFRHIAEENDAFCAKWGMGRGTSMHSQCLEDVQELRARIENRFAEEFDI